ncbi:ricin-type beta-trefoil lectin domain protein [Rugosimonospora acidiphila]|uniref:galactosylceramidase n=1 Tax=Rugosimonospora acidiphila TaxID=556531 RepID=A0ABP9RKS3_9ACTN
MRFPPLRQALVRAWSAVCAALLLTGVLVGLDAAPATAATTTITINGSQGGRTFDGVGAISGGGGNSRLLIDYPEPERSQILDYLFKPGYGANVQLLKIEIGGDANSTDGAEPSIEHARGAVNCAVGYEFWLAQQAKARNPNLKLYGLAWAAPGWIGGGDFWSQDMIDYLMTWLGCAKSDGLAIDYLGGWNERGHDKGWYETLHSTLASNGYGGTKVVGDDTSWGTADDMVADPAFKAAVDIVGDHYPCGYLSDSTTCNSTANAVATGKPLWASENGSLDADSGAQALIRSITRGYIDGKMTAYLNWPLVAAITPNLPFSTVGLAVAPSPWSGSYRLGKEVWAMAQVTQFAQPGWTFIDSASGYLGGARANGSYVTLKSPNGSDYSSIIETTTATAAQTVTVHVSGGLSTGTVHVWATNLASANSSGYFVRQPDVTPSAGGYTLTLQPGYVYSLTTTTGQGKGTATSPSPTNLALPYSDTFDGYATNAEARYVADQQGSFEVRTCAAGRTGKCLQQVTPVKPIEWQGDSDAFALAGDTTWSNYTVSVDVNLQQAGTAELIGRANTQSRPQNRQAGYELRVGNTGAWQVVKNSTSGTLTTLASGTTTALGLNSWHTLTLTLQGSTITAKIGTTTLATVNDTSYVLGQVGVGVVGYQTDQFDNLVVTPGTGGVTAKPITSGMAGKCLQAQNGASADGTPVVIATCDAGSAAQNWTVAGSNTLQFNGKCLDVTGQGTADGTLVELWTCNGGTNQQWAVGSGSSLIGTGSGKCLDDPALSTTDGTQQEIWTCNGGANQVWHLPT